MPNEYDALVTGAAPSNANPYLDLLTEADRLRMQQVAASTLSAADVNPDTYAAQRRTAAQLGVPPAVVEADPQAANAQALLNRVQTDIAHSPTLQVKYTDADFAKLAHDDSGVLKTVADAARYIFSHPDESRTLVNDLRASGHDVNRGLAGVMRAGTEFAAPLLDWMEAPDTAEGMATWRGAIGGNPLRRFAEGIGQEANYSGRRIQELSPPTDNTFAAGVSSGVRSFGSSVITLPMALLPGGQSIPLFAGSAVPCGPSFVEARRSA